MTKLAYYFLRGEDGMIYDNIRYNPNAILTIDEPLVKYMGYVNKLQSSIWSVKEFRICRVCCQLPSTH